MKSVAFSNTRRLTLDELQSIALDGLPVSLASEARGRIALGRQVLSDALENGIRVYGLNTGLGHNRDVDIPQEVLEQYQIDIVIGHAGAIGDPLPTPEVRAIMASRLAGACRGYSGLSLPTAEFYAALLNAGIIPDVPAYGSVGASDLGTLAAVASTMIGRGRAFLNGKPMRAAEALQKAGLSPITLGPKEGLGVISENSYSIGVGTLALGETARTLRLADLGAALTMEALRSSLTPLDPEVAVARPFRGQATVAANIRGLLVGSYLEDPTSASSLQDPLSIRTVAQVHGAVRECYSNLAYVVETELNASDDNPMVSPDSGRALSTGNFHPLELALGFESLRLALAHLALICERRIRHLTSAISVARKEVPSGFIPETAVLTEGLGSRAYAAISARIEALAAPVTLGIPSLENGQEDHATGAPLAVDTTRQVVALLEDMFVGEITLAVAVLSRRADVQLGRGTKPFFDAVVEAYAEGEEGESAAALVRRVKPRLLSMTSRRIAFESETDQFRPTPHHLSETSVLRDSGPHR